MLAGNVPIHLKISPFYSLQQGCILTGVSPILCESQYSEGKLQEKTEELLPKASIWVAPLVTDSCIFILTLWQARVYIMNTGRGPTMHILIRDGILYFLVIFLANLMNTLIFFVSHFVNRGPKYFIDMSLQLAPLDLRAVGASFSQLITNVMISRLVLNLRHVSTLTEHYSGPSGFNAQNKIMDQSFMTRTIGNLGNNLITSGSSTGDAKEENLELRLVNRSCQS